MGGVKRPQHALEQRGRRLVRTPVDRGLSLLVRKLGGGPHHDAVELVRALAPVGAEDHAHRKRGPVLEGAQRAQVVRDPLRQHRHHPVGKIDRIAALERLAIEGRAGADVGRDVGDGDGDHEPAGVAGVGVGRRMDRVVVVLGVGRIDGHERQSAPVLARRAEPDGPRSFSLLQRLGREDMRDVMGRERNQAHRALGLDRADRLDDARVRRPDARVAQRLDGDEIAVPRLAGHGGRHEEFARRPALLDRQRPARAVRRGAIDGEGAAFELVEDLDHPAGIGRGALPGAGVEVDPHQDPRAEARRRRALALGSAAANDNARRGRFPAPLDGPCDQFAVAVALGDVGDDERGQAALDGERLAAARDGAFGLQILEDELQSRLGFTRDAEGASDVALGDPRGRPLAIGRWRSADEGHHLLARRKRRGPRFSRVSVSLRRAPTDFLILQGFHFSRAAEAPRYEGKFDRPRKQAVSVRQRK